MNPSIKLKNILIIPVLIGGMILSSAAKLDVHDLSVKVIVIDAGHGGKDPGCHGTYVEEADVALAVALKLGNKIKAAMPDVKVVYTRDSDHFVELHERAKIANDNGADIFISIHCNASASQSAYGTETYTMGLHKTTGNISVMERENSVILKEDNHEENYKDFEHSDEFYIMRNIMQSSNIRNSVSLASKVESRFQNTLKRKSRGVQQAGFLVLWKTTMPSILIETGFLTNSNEESYLKTAQGQEEMAGSIFSAVKEYKEELSN